MKRIIQTIIASVLALSLVYLPALASPSSQEAGPAVPKVTSINKIKPLAAPTTAEIAPVADIPAPVPIVAPVQPQAQSAPVAVPVSTGGCVSGYFTGDVYLDNIIRYESGGNSCATNPGGCFGLLQACPGYPLRAACGGDPGCQIAWFQANKTSGRSWAQVWQHELDYGWW